MANQILLLDAITATAATKIPFVLTNRDFAGNSTPKLRSRGLGSGDTILIWEFVNDDWQDTGVTLSSSQTSRLVESTGAHAVTAVLATSGPVSVEITSSARAATQT